MTVFAWSPCSLTPYKDILNKSCIIFVYPLLRIVSEPILSGKSVTPTAQVCTFTVFLLLSTGN